MFQTKPIGDAFFVAVLTGVPITNRRRTSVPLYRCTVVPLYLCTVVVYRTLQEFITAVLHQQRKTAAPLLRLLRRPGQLL